MAYDKCNLGMFMLTSSDNNASSLTIVSLFTFWKFLDEELFKCLAAIMITFVMK